MTAFFWFLIGVNVGYLLTGFKFVRNANEIQRIEFFGKLYKVLHDKDWHGT